MCRNRTSPLFTASARRFIVVTVFGAWTVLAGATLWELGRLPCGLPRQFAAEQAWAEAGWQAGHWLPDDTATTALVADHLLSRGPLPGLREIVWLAGGASRWATALRARGWIVRAVTTQTPPPAWATGNLPAVHLESAEVRWTACHDVAGLSLPGSSPLDTLIFRAIAAGRRVPERVPAGCRA